MSEEPPSLETMQRKAGAIRSTEPDEIDAVRAMVRSSIDKIGEGQSSRELSLAKTKADEMIFWLRAHKDARNT